MAEPDRQTSDSLAAEMALRPHEFNFFQAVRRLEAEHTAWPRVGSSDRLEEDFLRFCHANPKPCPLLGVSDAGDPAIPTLGADLDIRTDLPRYRVWRDGELIEEPRDIKSEWRDDLVSFVLG